MPYDASREEKEGKLELEMFLVYERLVYDMLYFICWNSV